MTISRRISRGPE